MNYKKESGKRLKAARTSKGWTLEEMSRRVGGVLSTSRLGNYEQGLRMMGVRECLALARVLSVKPSHLLCLEEDEDMTPQETNLLRNFRALPERERVEYARRIEVLAQVYREPVADERLSDVVRRGPKARRSRNTQ